MNAMNDDDEYSLFETIDLSKTLPIEIEYLTDDDTRLEVIDDELGLASLLFFLGPG